MQLKTGVQHPCVALSMYGGGELLHRRADEEIHAPPLQPISTSVRASCPDERPDGRTAAGGSTPLPRDNVSEAERWGSHDPRSAAYHMTLRREEAGKRRVSLYPACRLAWSEHSPNDIEQENNQDREFAQTMDKKAQRKLLPLLKTAGFFLIEHNFVHCAKMLTT